MKKWSDFIEFWRSKSVDADSFKATRDTIYIRRGAMMQCISRDVDFSEWAKSAA